MISHEQSLHHILTSTSENVDHHNHQQYIHHYNNQQNSYNHSPINRISFVMLIVPMVFLIIFSELQLAHSNPVPSTKGSNEPNLPVSKLSADDLRRECYPGSDLRDLCEMCAKVTRNVNTFPWCCTRQFNVTQWCEEYLTYTIGPNK